MAGALQLHAHRSHELVQVAKTRQVGNYEIVVHLTVFVDQHVAKPNRPRHALGQVHAENMSLAIDPVGINREQRCLP